MNPQNQALRFRPLSPMGADRWGYVCGEVTVWTEAIFFHKGHGGPAER